MLYAGEQFDTYVKQYYLRARYYDPGTGRFGQVDAYRGNSFDPLSFHKYAYVKSDPINAIDPTGNFYLLDLLNSLLIITYLRTAEIGAKYGAQIYVATKAFCITFAALATVSTVLEYGDVPTPEYVEGLVTITGCACTLGLFLLSVLPQPPPKGMNNPEVREAANLGNRFHYDMTTDPDRYDHVGGPTQLQNRYPDTRFDFARRGQGKFDVTVTGGQHPSTYPGSTWPSGVDQGDFKPDTVTGRAFKLPSAVHRLLYNAKTQRLL